MLEPALSLSAQHNWRLFPANLEDGSKKSYLSRKHAPEHQNWGMTSKPEQLRKDFSNPEWCDKCGIGIPTGSVNNIFVFEADTKEKHKVDGLASLKALQDKHGLLPGTLMAMSPSGSVHYYFKHPGADIKIKSSASEIAPGIDVKGDGGMVIAAPSKRDDGVYRWANDLQIIDAPAWLLDLIYATAAATKGTDKTASNDNADPFATFADELEHSLHGKPSLAMIKAALDAIPNTSDVKRNQWRDIGQSIKSEYPGDDGFVPYDTWSATWPGYKDAEGEHKYDEKKTREAWDSFRPHSVTIGTLFYYANEATPGWREAFEYADAQEQVTPDQDDDERSAYGYSWKLHWHGDAAIEDSRPFLIQNLLPECGYGLMPGQWGTYKTFIACEGQSEMTIRLEAVLKEKCPGFDKAPFTWVSGSPRLLDPNAAKILTAMIKDTDAQIQSRFGVPLVLVVIDTQGKAAGYTKTGEGNDDATAKIIQRACNAAALACNVFILGVDHFGKDASVGTKGSSGKEDDADVILSVLGEKDIRGRVSNPRLCLRKRRGGESGIEYPFSVRQIDMGFDQYGCAMTTLVIDWTPPDAIAPEPNSAWGKTKALRLLRTVLDVVTAGAEVWQIGNPDTQPPPQAIDIEIVREEFYARYVADQQDAKRKAFHRVLTEAQDLGLLAVRAGEDGITRVWTLRD
jgi:hypothetical protein